MDFQSDSPRRQVTNGRTPRFSRPSWIFCTGMILSLPAFVLASEPASVAVLFVERSPYAEAARALATGMRSGGATCELVPLTTGEEAEAQAAFQRLRQRSLALVATAGPQLTNAALRELPHVRILHFMVPNVLDAPFVSTASAADRLSGVTCDIAPAEQVRWIRRVSPAARRVALLYSERTHRTSASLVAAGREAGLEIVTLAVRADKFTEATKRLDQEGVDGVLMIPDAQVYNAANVQHLLLWGMRQERGVWAFSDKVVKAGALAGVYCDPEDIGREAAELGLSLLRGVPSARAALRYPSRPRYGLNLRAARMLKLSTEELARDESVERFGVAP